MAVMEAGLWDPIPAQERDGQILSGSHLHSLSPDSDAGSPLIPCTLPGFAHSLPPAGLAQGLPGRQDVSPGGRGKHALFLD